GLGDPVGDSLAEDRGVGHEQVVAHQLHAVTESFGQQLPARPVVLGHAVFDGDDRVVVHPVRQVVHELGRIEALAFGGEFVMPVLIEFRTGNIQAQVDVDTGFVATLLDGGADGFQGG